MHVCPPGQEAHHPPLSGLQAEDNGHQSAFIVCGPVAVCHCTQGHEQQPDGSGMTGDRMIDNYSYLAVAPGPHAMAGGKRPRLSSQRCLKAWRCSQA